METNSPETQATLPPAPETDPAPKAAIHHSIYLSSIDWMSQVDASIDRRGTHNPCPSGPLFLESEIHRHFDRSGSRICDPRSGEICFSTSTSAKPAEPS